MRFDLPRIGLWAALSLALFGTLGNTAWTFATVDNGDLLNGYIKAIAVDVGMIALAAHIQQRKRRSERTWPVWIGAFAFAGVSIYANYLHGVAHTTPLEAPLAEWRPHILAAILPLILLYLVEIVSHAPQPAPLTAPASNPTPAPAVEPVAPSAPASLEASLPIAPVPLACEHCDRTFDTINALNAHQWRCKARHATQPATVSGNGTH